MTHTINLNIHHGIPQSRWDIIVEVYRTLPGWIEGADWPSWYGKEGDKSWISASVEPSGLCFSGVLEPVLWTGWVSMLCGKLSVALGHPIYEAELCAQTDWLYA